LDKLGTFHRLLKEDSIEAVKYLANISNNHLYRDIRDSMRDLNRPNITQEALDDAKRKIQSQARSLLANKKAYMHLTALDLGLTKDHADTLMNDIKYSARMARINKIIKPAARRLRGIGLLSGLLAGSGAGLGIRRLISD
jgi:hypothetical protein